MTICSSGVSVEVCSIKRLLALPHSPSQLNFSFTLFTNQLLQFFLHSRYKSTTPTSPPLYQSLTLPLSLTLSQTPCSKMPPRSLFDTYASDASQINPEGLESLFKDLQIPSHSLHALAFMWSLSAKQMGFCTRKEWNTRPGLTSLSTTKSHIESTFTSIVQDQKKFEDFYRFLFDFCKEDPEGQKFLPLPLVLSLLECIFASEWEREQQFCTTLTQRLYPHINGIICFLRHRQLKGDGLQALNKDQWNSILLFARLVPLDFSGYDARESWPLLLDEFVHWSCSSGAEGRA